MPPFAMDADPLARIANSLRTIAGIVARMSEQAAEAENKGSHAPLERVEAGFAAIAQEMEAGGRGTKWHTVAEHLRSIASAVEKL